MRIDCAALEYLENILSSAEEERDQWFPEEKQHVLIHEDGTNFAVGQWGSRQQQMIEIKSLESKLGQACGELLMSGSCLPNPVGIAIIRTKACLGIK